MTWGQVALLGAGLAYVSFLVMLGASVRRSELAFAGGLALGLLGFLLCVGSIVGSMT